MKVDGSSGLGSWNELPMPTETRKEVAQELMSEISAIFSRWCTAST